MPVYPWLTGALAIEQLTVTIADLPPSLHGLTLVQLSDLHYDGISLGDSLLAEAIAASNNADPDLVLLTGDFVAADPRRSRALIPHLKQLRSRSGCFAILGNHDLYYRLSRSIITTALNQAGIRVLWNQVAYPVGPDLALVGLADFWSPAFDPGPVLSAIPAETPRIVLSHNPDSAAVLRSWRVDLQLSGHTHGGQIVLPGLGPIGRLLSPIYHQTPSFLHRWIPYLRCRQVVQHWEWSEGLHRVGTNQLYVNRGLATYPPGRLLCPPEVTVLRLVE